MTMIETATQFQAVEGVTREVVPVTPAVDAQLSPIQQDATQQDTTQLDASEQDAIQQDVTQLSVHDALCLALDLHRSGAVDAARMLYERILDVEPDHSDALQFLGVLLHQCGDSDAALASIERSIALDPVQPACFNNLGNILLELGRCSQASDAYLQAIALQPQCADAYNNLGAALRGQGRLDEAGAAYLAALAIAPDHVDVHNNMGNLLASQGRTHEAIACYCKAITLMPGHSQSRKLLGIAYYTLGQTDAAAQVFHRWLQDEPGHPVALHLHAACSGQRVPTRASDAYVETTFDDFAASFDAKLDRLAYRAPALVADALAKVCPVPRQSLVALDAGCGTGLCGPLLRPYVCSLTGVDLSSGMLARAQARGSYDALIKAELSAYLNDHPEECDLIVSADTLVYFGALDAVFAAARRALRRDGWLIFTVEEGVGAGAGHAINPHGRYSHDAAYVRQALVDAGLVVLAIVHQVLRMEGGHPVHGLVVTAAKVASARQEQSDGRNPACAG